MTHEDFAKHQASFWEFIQGIGKTKGKEYSGADDRLANFKRLADRLGVTPETVCLIYGTKHLDSIASYVKEIERTGTPPLEISEPIEGRFHDAVMYMILLSAIVAERKQEDVLARNKEAIANAAGR